MTTESHTPERGLRTLALKPELEVLPQIGLLQIGDRVRIEKGPFAGAEAVLLQSGSRRAIVSLQVLERSIAVEFDSHWLTPLI
jgi:transcription antitermination factor NusG